MFIQQAKFFYLRSIYLENGYPKKVAHRIDDQALLRKNIQLIERHIQSNRYKRNFRTRWRGAPALGVPSLLARGGIPRRRADVRRSGNLLRTQRHSLLDLDRSLNLIGRLADVHGWAITVVSLIETHVAVNQQCPHRSKQGNLRRFQFQLGL